MNATSPPRRSRTLLRAAGGFLVFVALVAGVLWLQRGGSSETAAEPQAAAAADSAQVAGADSAAADSSAAAAPKAKKKGLLGFLRRASNDTPEAKKPEPPAVPVELAAVQRGDVPSYFTGTATIEAEKRTFVLAKIAGTIEAIHVEEGDRVHEGDVLLNIEDAEERGRLEELRVRAASLEREYERSRSLLAKGLASDREFEDKKLLMDEARAKLQVGEIRLGYTKVRAPFSGRITQRLVQPGAYVQLNEQLFEIADFEPLRVRVYMPEREVDRVAVGQPVQVIADNEGGRTYPGHVQRIAPIVDTKSGTVKVTVELDGRPEDLRLGAFVRVRITTDVHRNALVVPKVALVEEGGDTWVFRAEADSVVKVRVQTGYTGEKLAEVLVGLREGDRVVTVGQGGLRPGARYRDLLAEAPADSGQVRAADDSGTVARR